MKVKKEESMSFINLFFISLIGVIAVLGTLIFMPSSRSQIIFYFTSFLMLFIGIIIGKISMKGANKK